MLSWDYATEAMTRNHLKLGRWHHQSLCFMVTSYPLSHHEMATFLIPSDCLLDSKYTRQCSAGFDCKIATRISEEWSFRATETDIATTKKDSTNLKKRTHRDWRRSQAKAQKHKKNRAISVLRLVPVDKTLKNFGSLLRSCDIVF